MGMESDRDLDNDEKVENYEMSDEEYFLDVDIDSQKIWFDNIRLLLPKDTYDEYLPRRNERGSR